MRKLSIIIATLFVFILAGCVKDTKVNLPKAGPEAAKTVQEVMDYVVENGAEDKNCSFKYECYKFVGSCAKKFGIDNTKVEMQSNLEARAQKNKFRKKDKALSFSFSVTTVYSQINNPALKYQYENVVSILDQRVDGGVDFMKYTVVEILKADDSETSRETTLEIEFKDGKVTKGGAFADVKGPLDTPEGIQVFYQNFLLAFLNDVKNGIFK